MASYIVTFCEFFFFFLELINFEERNYFVASGGISQLKPLRLKVPFVSVAAYLHFTLHFYFIYLTF